MSVLDFPDLVACPYCGMTGPGDGEDNIFVHLLEAHPFSWQAELISSVASPKGR